MQRELHGAYCLPRDVNSVLEKAGKAIDRYISTAVGAQAEIESLKAKLGAIAPQGKRKRVRQDPDTKFARVHEVVEAQEAAACDNAAAAVKKAKVPEKPVHDEAEAPNFSAVCTQFEL